VTFSSLLGGLKSLRNSSLSAPHLFYLESNFQPAGRENFGKFLAVRASTLTLLRAVFSRLQRHRRQNLCRTDLIRRQSTPHRFHHVSRFGRDSILKAV